MIVDAAQLNTTQTSFTFVRGANDDVMLGQTFDPNADLSIREHCRPHWSQAGAIVFITFRAVDSIPREVIRRWECEKHDWLIRAPERHDSAADPHRNCLRFSLPLRFPREVFTCIFAKLSRGLVELVGQLIFRQARVVACRRNHGLAFILIHKQGSF